MSAIDDRLKNFRVGNTELADISAFFGEDARVFVKMEMQNATGSAKDRAAFYIIKTALEDGRLKPGGSIVEASSGNTGIALAAIAQELGIGCKIFMPESMSEERKELLRSLGADLICTPAKQGMTASIEAADKYVEEHENCILADQFANPANPLAHFETTGPEIWEQSAGDIDIFVAGVGTGGTICGCSKYLKSQNPDIAAIAVGPKSFDLFADAKTAPTHGLQGLSDLQTEIVKGGLAEELIDLYIQCVDEDAFKMMKEFYLETGVKIGISSGAVLYAIGEVLKTSPGKRIVGIMHDTGERYDSMNIF